ncbi:MAG TPA: J domain-containing protein [Lacipirellulaceae bacterium]|nr:J domain-containing protein [Lacipirellulaceae bacterium]
MPNPQSSISHSRDHRPEFMATLGLAPPYAIEDVHQAYREKAKQTHPDRGGSAAAFNAVHEAFQQAQAYLEFRTDRRKWIAARMGRYVALEAAAARLSALGASISTVMPRWLEQSFGDFAQLTETPVLLRAIDVPNGDQIIAALVSDSAALRELEAIELTGASVTDDAVLRLAVFQNLRRLNLARTPVTARVLELIDAIPTLQSLALDGANVGWWSRRRAAGKLRRRLAGDETIAAPLHELGEFKPT